MFICKKSSFKRENCLFTHFTVLHNALVIGNKMDAFPHSIQIMHAKLASMHSACMAHVHMLYTGCRKLAFAHAVVAARGNVRCRFERGVLIGKV